MILKGRDDRVLGRRVSLFSLRCPHRPTKEEDHAKQPKLAKGMNTFTYNDSPTVTQMSTRRSSTKLSFTGDAMIRMAKDSGSKIIKAPSWVSLDRSNI